MPCPPLTEGSAAAGSVFVTEVCVFNSQCAVGLGGKFFSLTQEITLFSYLQPLWSSWPWPNMDPPPFIFSVVCMTNRSWPPMKHLTRQWSSFISPSPSTWDTSVRPFQQNQFNNRRIRGYIDVLQPVPHSHLFILIQTFPCLMCSPAPTLQMWFFFSFHTLICQTASSYRHIHPHPLHPLIFSPAFLFP